GDAFADYGSDREIARRFVCHGEFGWKQVDVASEHTGNGQWALGTGAAFGSPLCIYPAIGPGPHSSNFCATETMRRARAYHGS
ncbi:MAG: hypothetical protein WA734_20545, partial [Candidatus Acidiferrales bacterium]